VDKLEKFGARPTSWAALLRPIFKRFVKAIDGEPRDVLALTFLTGWTLMLFCVIEVIGYVDSWKIELWVLVGTLNLCC